MSCLCLKTIARDAAYRHTNHDVAACVQVSISGTIRIVPTVKGDKGKLRRSRNSRHEGIKLLYCPLCGDKLEKTHYQIWHDGTGEDVREA